MSIGSLLLIAVNLLPVAGILFGDWDAFALLVLYWLETLVIGFWTMTQVAFEPQRVHRRAGGPIKAVFLTINAGVFMIVHFLFLWMLFAGPWKDRVTDPASFIDLLVIGTGLWAPLVLLFASRGVLTLLGLFATDFAARLGVTIESGAKAIKGFYARILTLHVILIAGGWAVMMLGHQRALVAVVAIKILIDLLSDPLVKTRRRGQLGVA